MFLTINQAVQSVILRKGRETSRLSHNNQYDKQYIVDRRKRSTITRNYQDQPVD